MINWTEEKISEMQALWREGLSYAQIAKRLSHSWGVAVTKNVIVGAIHRHMPKLAKIKAKARRRKQGMSPKAVRLAKKEARKEQLKEILPGLNALFGLKAIRDKHRLTHIPGMTCQYIRGEPKDRDFCGLPAVRDSAIPHAAPVWCEHHIRVVYVQKVAKKKKVAVKKGGRVVWETVV